jgi:hypothetical protein
MTVRQGTGSEPLVSRPMGWCRGVVPWFSTAQFIRERHHLQRRIPAAIGSIDVKTSFDEKAKDTCPS